jgi:hypothetical protein
VIVNVEEPIAVKKGDVLDWNDPRTFQGFIFDAWIDHEARTILLQILKFSTNRRVYNVL